MAVKMADDLQKAIKETFGGCTPEMKSKINPTKIRGVLYVIPNCEPPCFEIVACGQAIEIPVRTMGVIEHEEQSCSDSVQAMERSPSGTITVENFSHEFYWKPGRYKQLYDEQTDGKIVKFAVQTFAPNLNDNEIFMFKAFLSSLGMTTGATSEADPTVIQTEFTVTGDLKVYSNLQIKLCGAGDIQNNV